MLGQRGCVARLGAMFLLWLVLPFGAWAQTLTFATVERPPFSMESDGAFSGFTIDLLNAVGEQIGRDFDYRLYERFPDMFTAITEGEVDGAAANISITSEREAIIDFTQPVFEAGIGIMVPLDESTWSVWTQLLTWDLALAIVLAFAGLFLAGMVMWFFERGKQEYFDRPVKDVMFPAFWWALNLVVNGGFEERVAKSRVGRIFSVLLVLSSLFVVSIFVAHITAAITVDAIASNVDGLNDLEGRRVASTEGSTSSQFLEARGIAHSRVPDYDTLIAEFEAGELDAVVFDRPILAWYVRNQGAARARLVPRLFRPENYGIALPSGSPLREPINRAVLRLREDGTYDEIRLKWFGSQ